MQRRQRKKTRNEPTSDDNVLPQALELPDDCVVTTRSTRMRGKKPVTHTRSTKRRNVNLTGEGFGKDTKTVEEDYRNVSIDNELSAGTNAFKGKYNKGKSKGKYGKKGQNRYTDFTGGKQGSMAPYSKGEGRGKEYQSRPYNIKGKGKRPYCDAGTYRFYNNTYGRPVQDHTTKEKAKATESPKERTTAVIHNNKIQEKERKKRPKEQAKEQALSVTCADDQGQVTRATSVGGKDRLTTSTNQLLFYYYHHHHHNHHHHHHHHHRHHQLQQCYNQL
eukprot:6490584-Amphidinium_carterae.3